jgi:hypothetical protein
MQSILTLRFCVDWETLIEQDHHSLGLTGTFVANPPVDVDDLSKLLIINDMDQI